MTFRHAKLFASAGLGIVITMWHHLADAGDRRVRSDRPIAGVSAVAAPSPEVPEGRMDSSFQLAGLVSQWIVRVLAARTGAGGGR